MKFKVGDVLYFHTPYFATEADVPKYGYTVIRIPTNCDYYELSHPTFGMFRINVFHGDRHMDIFGIKQKLDLL